MQISGSFSTGRVAYYHDVRVGKIPGNVDQNLTLFNQTLIDNLQGQSITEYTDQKFQPVIDEYNASQKRSDRKIKIPYSEWHVTKGKSKCPLAYEAVFQFGDHENIGKRFYEATDEQKWQIRSDLLPRFERFVQEMQEEFPHLEILYATAHFDEPNGTPHVHICYQPVGEDYQQGLPRQVSIGRALELDGIKRCKDRRDAQEIGGYQLTRFYRHMVEKSKEMALELSDVLAEQLSLKPQAPSRPHLPTGVFQAEAEKGAEEGRRQAEEIVREAKEHLQELTDQTQQKQEQLGHAKREMAQVTANLEDAKEELEEKITEGRTQIDNLNAAIQSKKEEAHIIEQSVAEKQKQVEELDQSISQKRSILEKLEDALINLVPRWYRAYERIKAIMDSQTDLFVFNLMKKRITPHVKRGMLAQKTLIEEAQKEEKDEERINQGFADLQTSTEELEEDEEEYGR